jgi:MEMO1 family protein
MLIRKPSVAGSFYPSDSTELRAFCKTYLTDASSPLSARAVILPHAGYIYSGECACIVLSQITLPETILLLGPNHRGVGSEFALYSRGAWETPLGQTVIAEDLAASLLESSHDIHDNPRSHETEHSLEVIIPFLQYKKTSVKIAPLLIGTLDFEWAAEVAYSIGEMLASKTEPILIAISNDMSHYEPDATTRVKDRYAIDAILNLDAEGLLKAVKAHRISMCGIVPVYMLLKMKDQLKIKKATLADYRTSADASGDKDRVVGYAGFIFE